MRRFWSDRKGNIAVIFALAIVPIIGGIGAAAGVPGETGPRVGAPGFKLAAPGVPPGHCGSIFSPFEPLHGSPGSIGAKGTPADFT